MSNAITRTVQSTATKEVSTANFNGWDLNFTTETTDTNVAVSVYGTKGNQHLNASARSDGHVNIGFSQGSYDQGVANALAVEMEGIVNPEGD